MKKKIELKDNATKVLVQNWENFLKVSSLEIMKSTKDSEKTISDICFKLGSFIRGLSNIGLDVQKYEIHLTGEIYQAISCMKNPPSLEDIYTIVIYSLAEGKKNPKDLKHLLMEPKSKKKRVIGQKQQYQLNYTGGINE